MHVPSIAGALLHAAEAAHNSEPQHMLQHAPQDAIVQAPPAMAPLQPAAPLDLQTCLQQILHGQMVSMLTCRPSQQHLAVRCRVLAVKVCSRSDYFLACHYGALIGCLLMAWTICTRS